MRVVVNYRKRHQQLKKVQCVWKAPWPHQLSTTKCFLRNHWYFFQASHWESLNSMILLWNSIKCPQKGPNVLKKTFFLSLAKKVFGMVSLSSKLWSKHSVGLQSVGLFVESICQWDWQTSFFNTLNAWDFRWCRKIFCKLGFSWKSSAQNLVEISEKIAW